MKFSLGTCLCYLIAAMALTCSAQTVPQIINYQGKLTDASGQPLPTADYVLSFSVYGSSNGTDRVWGPQVFNGSSGVGHGPRIPVVQGYFNVLLGPADTNGLSIASAFVGPDRWIEITIANDPPISPRQQVLSAPFAFRAANADNAAKLNGFDWSAVFNNGNPQSGNISGSRITDGTLPTSKLTSRPIGTNVDTGGLALSLPLVYQRISQSDGRLELTNLVVTIRTIGRPVFLSLVGTRPDPTAPLVGQNSSYLQVSTSPHPEVYWEIWDETGAILRFDHYTSGTSSGSITWSPSNVSGMALPPAGQHTYRVKAIVGHEIPDSSTTIGQIVNVQLLAYEL